RTARNAIWSERWRVPIRERSPATSARSAHRAPSGRSRARPIPKAARPVRCGCRPRSGRLARPVIALPAWTSTEPLSWDGTREVGCCYCKFTTTRGPLPSASRGERTLAADMIELRTPEQLEEMRPAGRFVASVLTALTEAADVGVNLLDLDALAHDMIRDAGDESCYIDYHPSFGAMPFGQVLCTSVNDAVLHGLPHKYKLRDGDLLTFDFAASLNGWVSDSALSMVVGTPRDEDLALIDTTERALAAAIDVARAGNRLGD